ncbi:hypothetical protein RHMOL_Rhmol10G0093800 [Rhododendron molle]|uniref:Uncharacterized protein n=1 Tax=Rhododendron molle TaxID=49168 RepID=A0ACC0M250_RHOML|nr:hypothetical protein RHMOL_Rhmol10G0093800 [Rhododendron molle]
MPKADKAPYIRSANEAKAKKPKEKRKTAMFKCSVTKIYNNCIVQPIFRSRCSPKKLGELNKKLTNNQRKVVQQLGFGSLLNLQCNMLPRDFIWKLVEHFNPKTRTLEFGRLRTYEITTADVARALGFKLGGVLVPTNCEDDHVKHIKSLFLEKGKKLTRGLTVKMMDHVFDKKTFGKKFKAAYVLYALCCFLCPTTKDEAGPKLFPDVRDLDAIPHYAWPQFVLDWLLLYFDKEPMGMTVGQEGGPLIECWTQLRIQQRIAKEENLELLDPTLSQFPQPRLRHPICIEGFQLAKRMFIKQVEQIKKTDDNLMEALGNKPTERDECISDFQNKPSGEQNESDESDGGSESDKCDGGEENDGGEEGDESDSDGGEKGDESRSDVGEESDRGQEGDETDEGEETEHTDGGEKIEGDDGGEETKCAEKDVEPKGVEPMSHFPEIDNQVDMPIYTPELVTIHDYAQAGIYDRVDKRHAGENKQGKEELDQQKKEEVDKEKDDDKMDEQVSVQGEEPVALSKPSKRQPNRVLKRSQSRKTPYVAHPEVKESKYTNEENSVYVYLMKQTAKSNRLSVFKNEGIGWILDMDQLQKEFKPRGHMSLFENLRKHETIRNHAVLNDEVHPQNLGYDVAMCSVISGLYKVMQWTRKNLNKEFHEWPIVHPQVPQQSNT